MPADRLLAGLTRPFKKLWSGLWQVGFSTLLWRIIAMNARHLIFTLLCGISVCSFSFAGDRYFYRQGQQGYYCDQPPVYRQGCYIVCDRPGIVKIGDYPTITTNEADRHCTTCSHSVMVSQTTISAVNSCCGTTLPTSGDCWPSLVSQCRCNANGNPEKAPESVQGSLKVVINPGSSFYEAIIVIQGNVPVPQICVDKSDSYQFGPLTLNYNCAAELQANGQAAECNPALCATPCTVKTCEVTSRVAKCNAACVMCDTKGPLVLAIRRDRISGQRVADVFIGKEGHAAEFSAYPSTMRVLAEVTGTTINQRLKLSATEAVNLDTIATNPNPQTDLFAFMK